jgi:hypothetical protein
MPALVLLDSISRKVGISNTHTETQTLPGTTTDIIVCSKAAPPAGWQIAQHTAQEKHKLCAP